MRDKIIQHIIQKTKQGDYGFIEKLIDISSDRLLLMALPEDLKKEIHEDMTGSPISVITIKYKDGREEKTSYIDEIESFSAFHVILGEEKESNKVVSIRLEKGVITGGSELDGWVYSLEDAEIVWEEVLDFEGFDGIEFETEMTFTVKGKMRPDFSKEDLVDYLHTVEPHIHNQSLVGLKSNLEGVKLNVKEK